jgi:hypothetical protein
LSKLDRNSIGKIVMDASGEKLERDSLLIERPAICFFDMQADILDSLIEKHYNVESATLGSPIEVANKSKGNVRYVNLNYEYPANLHEFDIVVLDLGGGKDAIAYKSPSIGNATGGEAYVIHSAYPEYVFDPRPGGMSIVGNEINFLLQKTSLVIIFADSIESGDYRTVKISRDGHKWGDGFSGSTQDLYEGFPKCQNKTGRRLQPFVPDNALFLMIKKYFGESHYGVVFEHPQVYSGELYRDEDDKGFVPIALNDKGEIVSYIHAVGEGFVFVFPPVENKRGFILELFESFLPEHFPDVFPSSGQFAWLDSGAFPVPGEVELLANRRKIEEDYRNKVERNEQAILSLKEEFSFLRSLIFETGDNLVEAVACYLRWLGFDSVVNQDDHSADVLEEDLHVDCGDKLLVIEVKGIGGTSTDKACSQITKIKNRRMKQRNSFEVYGLYIVNHERYVSPDKRKNPPFTNHQLEDALLDERGLLTTYQLYMAYFLVRDGILSREDVRAQLFNYGLITLVPKDLVCLGLPAEHLMKGAVIVVDLQIHSIKVGDTIVARKNSHYTKHVIQSLQLDGVDVEEAGGGVVGIKLASNVPTKAEIFVRLGANGYPVQE